MAEVEFFHATDDDVRGWVRAELGHLGLTFAELAEKSRTGFDTEWERRAWFAMKDWGRFADG